MTLKEFDEVLQKIVKQVEKNKKEVQKQTSIVRPVYTEISS